MGDRRGGDRAALARGGSCDVCFAGHSFREVDNGLIKAGRALGGGRWTVASEEQIRELLPGLAGGFTVTLATLIGVSAMVGVVGSGGLRDLVIRCGYQRFETDVMTVIAVVLIALVSALQV